MKEKNTASSRRKKLPAVLSLSLAAVMLTGCASNPAYRLFEEVMYLVSESGDYSDPYVPQESAELTMDSREDEFGDSDDYFSDGSDNDRPDSQEGSYEGRDGTAAQTIMIYMVGSDLESEYGNASLDLIEMQDALPDIEHNNIVVYTGGAEEWYSAELSADYNSILLLEDYGFSEIDYTGADNMGDPDTLSFFINYCFEHFDSERYSLILWDHGGGPVVGFGMDENHKDLLDLTEMEEALEHSVGTSGKRLEWIGFDACLMSSLEIADLAAPYANYLIASQETEPGWGWNYSFLSSLSDRPMSGAEMGREIIDAYMDFGDVIFENYPRMYADLTLSCIDLKKYLAAEEELNTFFREFDSSLDSYTFPQVVRRRSNVRSFGSYSTDFNYCMLDAIHLLQLLDQESDSALSAIQALQDMVVYSRTNMENAGGISICYPYQTDESYRDGYIRIQEELEFATHYTRFLKDFYAMEESDSLAEDWNLAKAKTSVSSLPADQLTGEPGSDITLTLTQEQQANYVSGGFYILCNAKAAGYVTDQEYDRADEMYLKVFQSNNVTLDENGVLHAYYNNHVLYMHDNNPSEGDMEYSNIPMIITDKDSTPTEKRYLSFVVLQKFAESFSDWDSDAVQLQIVVNKQHPNGIIRSAIPLHTDEDDIITPGKQLLDLADYDSMSVGVECYYLTRDKKGNMTDFYDWEKSGMIMGFDQDLHSDYDLRAMPLQNPENYSCMFVLKDAQGNLTYSELIPLR